MSKIFTAAVVGGGIGRSHIVEGFVPNADKFKVLAICDLDPGRMNGLADEFKIERRVANFDDLLKMDDLDVIDICTPPMVHYPMILAALAAGKHVICEKPYSTSAAEVEEAHDLADASGLVLTEGFMWRHGPHAIRFLEELPRIGELRTVRATFSFQIESEDDIRLSRELAGGSLMDVGTYCVSAARLLVGREPLWAMGVAWPAESGVDERFSGILDFGDGVVATLTSGFRSRHSGIEAIGSEGSLRLDDPFAGRATKLVGSDGFEVTIPKVDPYELELDDFAAAIRHERPVRLGRADMLGQARALGALYESAASGRVVAVGG